MPISRLSAVLAPSELITDPTQIKSYATDWTGRWSSNPIAVALPKTLQEVTEIVRICVSANIKIAVQGGNTGLVGGAQGGATPHIILSTKKLRNELAVDTENRQLRVSAGFTLAEIQLAADKHGLQYPVDLAARASATIGGNVATNAGGVRVVAFGPTGKHVIGCEVVTSAGEVQQVSGNEWAGSEGRFGIITAVTLQLQLPRNPSWTALISCASVQEMQELCAANAEQLLAAEFLRTQHANLAAKLHGLPAISSDKEWLLLLEGDAAPNLPDHALVASQISDTHRFWQYRELQTETISRHRNLLKIDCSLPLASLNEFISELKSMPALGRITDLEHYVFGHLAVGNLHLAFANCTNVAVLEADVIALIQRCGGNTHAEHGVGQAKLAYLSTAEWAVRRAQNLHWDPVGAFDCFERGSIRS